MLHSSISINNKRLLVFLCLTVVVITVLIGIGGCWPNTGQSNIPNCSERRLLISAVEDHSADYSIIATGIADEKFKGDISINNLRDITISIDGTAIELDNAIRKGYITPEEIVAYASIDAREGICNLETDSENGLAKFVYCYPEFDLSVIHDIYETPDGQKHLINSLSFFEPNGHRNSNHTYIDETSKYLYPIDREDWGIRFEISSVSATGMTVLCEQSGGQHFGILSCEHYIIISSDTGELVSCQNQETSEEGIDLCISLQNNESTSFSIDWTSNFGDLPSGVYNLVLFITDKYDNAKIHPLSKNFYDSQIYHIEFSIP